MRKATLGRWGLMGSVAALGLMSSVGGANAYQTKFGDFEITFDTTVSVGASMRTADRNNEFLNESAGGNIDPRDNVALGANVVSVNTFGLGNNIVPLNYGGLGFVNAVRDTAFPGTGTLTNVDVNGNVTVTRNRNNYDGGINGDDGRLNYDRGDLIGAPVKANHDLLVKYQNFTLFARAVGFWDFVLNDSEAGERSTVTDRALGDVGRNYELLDLYLSGEFNILGSPLNLRVGKQVISWGEGTFIQNGINVFNPVDVSAFRRPGAEIKEGLVPVNAVFGSLGLPFSSSVSGWYALDFEPVEIDPAGTPFSGADVISDGSGIRGNQNRRSYISGSPFAGPRRNCDPVTAGLPVTIRDAIYASNLLSNPLTANGSRLDCTDSAFVNFRTPVPLKESELQRNLLINNGVVTEAGAGVIPRGAEELAEDRGQWGVAFRHYNDDLGVEFGAYAMNYHSRLPFVSMQATAGEVGISVQGRASNVVPTTTSAAGISSALAGRYVGGAGALASGIPFGSLDPRIAGLSTRPIADPQNIINAGSIAATWNTICRASQAAGSAYVTECGGLTTDNAATVTANTNATIGARIAEGDSYRNAIRMNQVLSLLQAGPLFSSTGVAVEIAPGVPAPALIEGAETLALNQGNNLVVTYPDDITLYGLSFNTTLFGWGVQGEVSYRPDAPFQQDTDAMTIAVAGNQCAFLVAASNAASNFEALGTVPGGTCNPASVGNRRFDGLLKRDMVTAQIGTTATFTSSDWMIEAIGADLGILLTEFGMVQVEDVESTWLTDDNGVARVAAPANRPEWVQFQNIGCQGSDLPLGGLLALDAKSSKSCRPTDISAGYVLVARATYNNAFNSGFAVSPTVSFSHDFYGTTPAPYSNYLQDRMSASLGVQAELNNNLRLNFSYVNFFGGHIANKATDQDFTSISAQYSF